MQIAALKELSLNEKRVAISPDSIKNFQRLGLEVVIEEGAGFDSGYIDSHYKESGAKIVNRDDCLNADICLCVKIPDISDIKKMKANTLLIGILNPYENKKFSIFFDLKNFRKIFIFIRIFNEN